jgi:hypothetical protein
VPHVVDDHPDDACRHDPDHHPHPDHGGHAINATNPHDRDDRFAIWLVTLDEHGDIASGSVYDDARTGSGHRDAGPDDWRRLRDAIADRVYHDRARARAGDELARRHHAAAGGAAVDPVTDDVVDAEILPSEHAMHITVDVCDVPVVTISTVGPTGGILTCWIGTGDVPDIALPAYADAVREAYRLVVMTAARLDIALPVVNPRTGTIPVAGRFPDQIIPPHRGTWDTEHGEIIPASRCDCPGCGDYYDEGDVADGSSARLDELEQRVNRLADDAAVTSLRVTSLARKLQAWS